MQGDIGRVDQKLTIRHDALKSSQIHESTGLFVVELSFVEGGLCMAEIQVRQGEVVV